jgi:hypothetical protein
VDVSVLASDFPKILPLLQGKKNAHATNRVDENTFLENGGQPRSSRDLKPFL